MSLLSYDALLLLTLNDVITNVKHEQINAASIDLTLGRYILVEERPGPGRRTETIISLRDRTPLNMKKIDLREGGFTMHPGQFILGSSEQTFNLPDNISAEYKLKSSMARIGLEHLNAGWCDAGWNGSVLTLELKNMTCYHGLTLHEGDGIGQVVFFEHAPVPADRSYAARGRYNGDTSVSGIKE